MQEKNIRSVNEKAYNIVGGLFLILFSIVLSINVGYVAKALSFVFVYLFGMGAYVIYAFLCIAGFLLMFRGKNIKLVFSIDTLFAFIVALGVLSLLTYLAVDQSVEIVGFANVEGKSFSFISKLWYIFQNTIYRDGTISTYFKPTEVTLFFGVNEFGCGFIGYLYLSLLNQILGTSNSGLIFSILTVALGLMLIIVPKLANLISIKIKTAPPRIKKTKAIKTKEPKSEEKPKHIEPKPSYAKVPRIKNINVIEGARHIDPLTYHSEVSGAGRTIEKFDETLIDTEHNEHIASGFTEAIFVAPSSNGKIKNVEPIKENTFGSNNLSDSLFKPVINKGANVDNFNEISKTQTNEIKDVIKPVMKPIHQQPTFNIEEPNKVEPQVQKSIPKPKIPWSPLSSNLLDENEIGQALEKNIQIAEERKVLINSVFNDFGVGAEVVDYTIGPSITRFNIKYAPNVSARSVNNLVQDISIRLSGVSARFETIIEGQSTSGLEIPNAESTMVSFKEIIDALPDSKKHPLAVGFGKNIQGNVVWADYDEFPHMLVAGTTGSGKSVFVNSIICSLIMRNSPDTLKLVLVDPKQVEMSRYADMPHLLTPIITEPSKVKVCLQKLVEEMETRYSLFSQNGATNIKEYNEDCEENGNTPLPIIIVILDEYANLIDSCKEISFPVVSLAQKARACGIHIMLATQRPSTDVVTGVIKANIPTHVALMCGNYVDSSTIIGEGGAEKLLGRGDMLVQTPLVSRVGVTRLQGCFINRKEMARIINTLKEKYPTSYDEKFLNLEEPSKIEDAGPEFKDSGENDDETKYRSIKEWVMSQEYISMSRIQRECGVGFNRAGRFLLRMQKEGVVNKENEGNRGFKVLMSDKFGDVDDTVVTSIDNSYIKD